MRKIQIGVIGPSKENITNNRIEKISYVVGKLIAKSDCILFTGGATGLMETVSRGAKSENGIVVGTPGKDRLSSNKFTDIEILTPLSIGNFLFTGILSSDVLIVIGESAGTTAELALAYRNKKEMIIIRGLSKYYDNLIGKSLDNKNLIKFIGVNNPKQAVDLAIKLAKKRLLKEESLNKLKEDRK